MQKIRIGLMGFGRIGRQLFQQALERERFEVVVISDIGQPEILHHLLDKTMGQDSDVTLESNYLVSERGRTRLMPADHPNEIPWDVFDVDFVIDASGRFRSMQELNPHLDNGAKRVILSVLPEGDVDRVVLFGVNEASATADDRIISAGSASTTATALALKIIMDRFAIEHATMTSVHAYTSDQALQDYAGADYRRSRSGAENIIPNNTPALHWVQQVIPEVSGKFTAYALNVPVQVGSMLDITVAFTEAILDVDSIKDLFITAEENVPALVGTTNDLIVSSDIKGCTKSLLVDLQGTIKAGSKIVKLLAWHESLGHACRILDIAETYADLDATERKEASS